MLIATAFLASMMSQYAQGGRIAYIGIKMDSETFVEGENVTFKFIPLTKDVYFSTSGFDTNYGMTYGYPLGSVHIIRIPDNINPDQIIQDRKLLDKISSWDNRDMTVSFDYFNSTDGTKSLSWNGTVMQNVYPIQGYAYSSVTYRKALGGNYLVFPQFTSLAGHSVKFQLDRNAIFSLETLRMTASPGINGSELYYNVTVSAPSTLTGVSSCTMSWSINGMTESAGNGSNNRAEFDLASGGTHDLTISEPGYFWTGSISFRLSGWIDTAWGNYTFEKVDWYINGGWSDSPQYYYYY
jgi:hypothetical protein